MKACVISLGCPKNLCDSEVLMGKLAQAGYALTTKESEADIIVVNTCAFLKLARKEARNLIKSLKKFKAKIYMAGCLPRYLDSSSEGPLPVDGIIDSIGLFECSTPRVKATPPWTAYIKISEGCNNRCSYCLIPKIRGRLRHRKVRDIVREARDLAGHGVKEIIYVAQDTTAHPNFPEILKKTAKIRGLKWIRIMYAHPAHISKKLLDVIQKEKKIVKYLDLPIQHSHDKILRLMNRPYTGRKITRLICEIRRRIPKITLRTSLIVGFPGETDADFKNLFSFIKETRFERLGVFPYSREIGTSAAKLRGQVPKKIKKARFHKLMQLQKRISWETNKAMIGKIVEILIEGRRGKYFVGRSAFDAPEIDGSVMIKSNSRLMAGEIKKARIISARAYDLVARLVT